MRGATKTDWPHGDYAAGIVFRFLLLFALWIFYGMVGHPISPAWLLLVTAIIVSYAFHLFSQQMKLMGWLIVVAAGLNTLLIPLHAAAQQEGKFIFSATGLPILLIFAILLFDIVNARMATS